MKKTIIYLSMLMAALVGLASCSEDYELPPLVNPDEGTDTVYGTGEWDNPITVDQMLGGMKGTDLWFTGYIVGWIDTKGGTNNKFSAETCTFTAPATLASNILMAAKADEKDYTKCIPVQLPTGDVRKALNLMDNPSNLGKQVTVKGTVTPYFGQDAALKSVTAYAWGGKGISGEGPDTPPGPGETETIFSALDSKDANGAKDWTFDNVNLPAGANYIWQWKEYNSNYYLNASAYVSGKALPSEAYAISPAISLSDYKKAVVNFEHAAKFQTTLRSLCGLVIREKGATEWTQLTIPAWPEAGSWSFAASGDIDLSAYAGKTVEIAFRYGSSASGADTWEIRNLKVTGNK